jgi:predicted RNA-binding protein with PIN domain
MKTWLIVDGYNLIHQMVAAEDKADLDLEAARERLIAQLSDYSGYMGYETVVVFDAYSRDDPESRSERRGNIEVVFTAKDVTADSYIERFVHGMPRLVPVKVVTSDYAVQQVVLALGGERVSSRELVEAMVASKGLLSRHQARSGQPEISRITEQLDDSVRTQLEKLRRGDTDPAKTPKKRIKK